MPFSRSRLALGAGLLLSLACGTAAVPSVNVGVRAAFSAPPYLVELLETAAEENATSYFPILDRIAEGHFDNIPTDKELYQKFRALLQQDGHLRALEDLSSFDLALSIHSAAPLVEAHYQFYNTSVELWAEQENGNIGDTWAYASFTGQKFSDPDLDPSKARQVGVPGEPVRQLPFDRILGDKTHNYATILYADLLSDSFRKFHKVISQSARDGKTSYRVRYIPSRSNHIRPLTVSGYGVELALKRTDYIVIDDRQGDGDQQEEQQGSASNAATLKDEEVADLRPLSFSEVKRLGMKAATFVMSQEDRMDTLVQLTQDFPKHSSGIAAVNMSIELLNEHKYNRQVVVPAGMNVLWINGVQIMPRDINVYSLLEHLRRERKRINGVRELGVSAPQAIDLLAHEAITESRLEQDVQRYEWRDELEGGDVIMWLNNIEKDKRYAEWPDTIHALLQRTFPGQLPAVRKDIHNLIAPVDFSNREDVLKVVDELQTFVKRKAPLRIGLVPIGTSPEAIQQGTIVYYLLDTYGLVVALDYLESSVEGAGYSFGAPDERYLTKACEGRESRQELPTLAMPDILVDTGIAARIKSAQAYAKRLALSQLSAPFLLNGVAITKNDDWLSFVSSRLGMDLRLIQQELYTGEIDDDSYLPDLFLVQASQRRSPMAIPENDKDLLHLDLSEHPEFAELTSIPANPDTIERELVHITILANLNTYAGFEQIMEALLFRRSHDNVELAWLDIPGPSETQLEYSQDIDPMFLNEMIDKYDAFVSLERPEKSSDIASELDKAQRQSIYRQIFDTVTVQNAAIERSDPQANKPAFRNLQDALGLQQDQAAIVLNGRVAGPFPSSTSLDLDDLETMFAYERKQRLLPASLAIEGLHLEEKASSPFAFAKVSNLIALSQISDVPEGIYESTPTIRSDYFRKWNSTYTSITAGDMATASIQLIASIDPASETGQRWVPIVRALSELDGVYTNIFLNPKEMLDELPVKRFYRHILDSKPSFDESGSLRATAARFSGLPAEALLNIGMDLPPSWLVAPEESIHDLDNIKLSAVRSGSDIEATYELEHILIEGHSTDVTQGQPPRGAQLVLGTEKDPHVADTIIMANVGYFQFKANPGVYNLSLQHGRSEEIFHIDSAGELASSSQQDNNTQIALTSFRGVTLFPSISRNPGMEKEDVLEASRSTLENLAGSADKMLREAGLPGGDYLAKAAKFGSSLLSGGGRSNEVLEAQADINMFSVASGHLYERMLNIMMLSVMKHTKHTVKFWFIEQFLSPSFKDFLPAMAEEYGFRYEMVTYKWPHWLRMQKEKQREIWGYKILFLDVLFPLDLDKVIFVDADQIVRTDMYELVQHDLEGAVYGFTPMCDSRVEMEGFRFWKQGYWKNFLRGLPYHISALYVVDLQKFRQVAAGDRLRQQYHQLSADPGSLSNLDQDLPNHMQMAIPIHSLPQDWLWCETWCSDEALETAKTIDLCNNPQTKEPKLDRARRQVPEWTVYDNEIAEVAKRFRQRSAQGSPLAGDAMDAGTQGEEEESIQERLQREDAERERKDKEAAEHKRDEL